MLTSLVVGRTNDNDLVIPSPFLSSTHAQIDLVDLNSLTFRIEDLGSTNGTSVNGEVVESAEFKIGDIVMLGEYELKPSDYLLHFIGSSSSTTTASPSRTNPLIVGGASVIGALAGVWVASGYFGSESFENVALEALALVVLIQIGVYVAFIGYKARKRYQLDSDYYRERHAGFVEKLSVELSSQVESKQVIDNRWSGFRKFQVVEKVSECRDITSYYLEPHDGKAIPSFYPGQYLTFRIKLPDSEGNVIRCYSLSDAYQNSCYRVTIKRAEAPQDKPEALPGLASSFFHDHVREGDILDVKAPSGKFYIDPASPEGVVLLAGGVGVTPLLAMATALIQRNNRNPVWFFYGVKNSLDLVQIDFLRKIAERNDNFHLVICFSRPAEYEKEGEDFDFKGHITIDLIQENLETNNYNFYVCGTGPFMASLSSGLKEWGVPKSKINMEAFVPSSISKSETRSKGSERQLSLEFARSNSKVSAGGGATILEIAEQNQIPIEAGCRVGNCGTCVIAIRKGTVEYDESYDADVEEGSCLACIARPASDLVLDI